MTKPRLVSYAEVLDYLRNPANRSEIYRFAYENACSSDEQAARLILEAAAKRDAENHDRKAR